MRAATLGSAGRLTHTIACNLHSHEPFSGFPAALVRPILSVQQSSFLIASCFPYFTGCILCQPPLLPVPKLWCLPFVSAGVLWYRGTEVQGYWDELTPIPFSLELCSHHQLHPTTESSVQAFLPSMAVPLPLILFSIFQNILSSEAILLNFGSGPSHYWVPWQ